MANPYQPPREGKQKWLALELSDGWVIGLITIVVAVAFACLAVLAGHLYLMITFTDPYAAP